MIIGLDIDGPVYPWHYSIYRHFVTFKGFEGSERDFWEYFRDLPKEVQRYFVRVPIHYLDQMPTPDVREYLPKIAKLGEIFYITARPPEAKWATWKFFNIYDLPFKENIIFSEDKATCIRLNRVDVFLDDRPAEVELVKGITDAYLFKAQHNWDERDNYKAVGSMKEFYEILKEMKNVEKMG